MAEVILAKTAGFCMGVRRAVDMVLEVSKRPAGRIVTYGPLIHNPQVLELLQLKGIEAAKSPSEARDSTVVIRAHGISPQVRKQLEENTRSICDATCPHVLHAQNIIKKHCAKGFHTVIVGDQGHAEVDGLLGCAGQRGYVVDSAEKVASLPENLDPVCVVAQTTQNRETFDSVCQALKARYPRVEVFSTICSATKDRQEEVREMAGSVDAMVIVGGRTSANTKRLAELSEETGIPTFLVESEEELGLEALSKFQKVGVTAGASTPYWMIDRVVETLRSLPIRKHGGLYLTARGILLVLLKGSAFTALGAASLAYTNFMFMYGWVDLTLLAVATTYALAMHISNVYANRHSAIFNEPYMAKFYPRYGRGFLVLAFVSAFCSLALASREGPLTFCVLIMATGLGLLYCLPAHSRNLLVRIAGRRLRAIPGSKDIFTAAAWSVVCVLVPFMNHPEVPWHLVVTASIWTFTLVFIRSIAFDIKDLQGDRIVGKETIPIVLGLRRTKALLLAFVFCQTATLVLGTAIGWAPPLGYWLLGSVAYVCLYLGLYHRRVVAGGIGFELLVDGSLLFPALLTALWRFFG